MHIQKQRSLHFLPKTIPESLFVSKKHINDNVTINELYQKHAGHKCICLLLLELISVTPGLTLDLMLKLYQQMLNPTLSQVVVVVDQEL